MIMNAMHMPVRINIKQISKRTSHIINFYLEIFIKYIRNENISITTVSIIKDKLKLKSAALGAWLPYSL